MTVPDAVIEGVAGAIGAIISLTATYPLLTVSAWRMAVFHTLSCLYPDGGTFAYPKTAHSAFLA